MVVLESVGGDYFLGFGAFQEDAGAFAPEGERLEGSLQFSSFYASALLHSITTRQDRDHLNIPIPVRSCIATKPSVSSSSKHINTTAWNKLNPTSYRFPANLATIVTVASCQRQDSCRFLCCTLYHAANWSMELWSCGGSLKDQPSLSRGYAGQADSVKTLADREDGSIRADFERWVWYDFTKLLAVSKEDLLG